MNRRKAGLYIFLLLAALLVAQTHFYTDATLPHAQAHSCPVCFFGIWAIPAPLPQPTLLMEAHRFEGVRATIALALSGPRFLSPRAPPAL